MQLLRVGILAPLDFFTAPGQSLLSSCDTLDVGRILSHCFHHARTAIFVVRHSILSCFPPTAPQQDFSAGSAPRRGTVFVCLFQSS